MPLDCQNGQNVRPRVSLQAIFSGENAFKYRDSNSETKPETNLVSLSSGDRAAIMAENVKAETNSTQKIKK